mgnify:CR=1 FL=1
MRNRVDTLSSLNVTDVTREAASQQSAKLHVVGVTIGNGDGDYAEVIIDLEDCVNEPCRMAVGVFRNASADAVRGAILKRLERHIGSTAAGPTRLSAAPIRRPRNHSDRA